MTEYDFENDEDIEASAVEDADPKIDGITLAIPASALHELGRSVAATVIDRLETRVIKAVEKKLNEIVDEAVRKVVGEQAIAVVTEQLMKPRQKFNEWGTPTGPVVTFNEQIPGVVENYLNAKVDDKGNVSNYSGDNKKTRDGWIIGQYVKADLDPVIQNTVSSITKQARDLVSSKVAAFVSEQMVPAIELKRPQ